MNLIEKILDQCPEPYWREDVLKAMKEYAKLMCQCQKEICSEEAETRDIHPNGSYLSHMVIDNNSILNSPFPEELQNEN